MLANESGDVYCDNFSNNVFDGTRTYQFRHPDTGRSVFYNAIWESDRWVGAELKLHFVGGGSVAGRVTVGGISFEKECFLLEKP